MLLERLGSWSRVRAALRRAAVSDDHVLRGLPATVFALGDLAVRHAGLVRVSVQLLADDIGLRRDRVHLRRPPR